MLLLLSKHLHLPVHVGTCTVQFAVTNVSRDWTVCLQHICEGSTEIPDLRPSTFVARVVGWCSSTCYYTYGRVQDKHTQHICISLTAAVLCVMYSSSQLQPPMPHLHLCTCVSDRPRHQHPNVPLPADVLKLQKEQQPVLHKVALSLMCTWSEHLPCDLVMIIRLQCHVSPCAYLCQVATVLHQQPRVLDSPRRGTCHVKQCIYALYTHE